MSLPEVHLIAAARPNFMKVAPLFHVLRAAAWCRPVIVHTGQHYDFNMSDAFFVDLGMPEPDLHLGVGSGSHAAQTAAVMVAYEQVCQRHRPAWVVVVGDVNSTMACSLVAAKLCIPLAHLEAGLRSRDRTMPEEINRLVTDAISDLLWTPSPDADANLRAEGVPAEKIECVGNIMIDAYERLREPIERAGTRHRFGLDARVYGAITLHRPSNVDDRDTLFRIVQALKAIADRMPLVFPVHPRTQARLQAFGLADDLAACPRLHVVEPMGYVEFLSLVSEARFIVTDSGGIQEETTYLHIPCLTLRENTERPITVERGTNRLVAPADLLPMLERVLDGDWPHGERPALWDGHAADRAAASLARRLGVAA